MRCTVWIVFNTFYNSRYAIFVTFKVNDTVMLLMTTTNVTSSNVTVVITTTSTFLLLPTVHKARLCEDGHEPLSLQSDVLETLAYILNRHNFRPYSAALSAVSPKSAISTSWPAFRVTYAFNIRTTS